MLGIMTEKNEYLQLIQEICHHDQLYFVECRPEITDQAYDRLVHRLIEIEKKHPEWITPSSPTQRIGEVALGFKQGDHGILMLSIANTYSQEEVEAFVARVEKLLGKKHIDFCAELKMDGTAISIRYEKGIFCRALTRGDGKRGDDVTANVRTILSVPMELPLERSLDLVEVRGEIFLPHRAFERLNHEQELKGEELYANPRNAAAGSLKLLDPQEAAKRKLSFLCYGVVEESAKTIATQMECHEWLQKQGFPGFMQRHRKLCRSVEEIMEFAREVEKERKELPFDIDGIVVKVNAFHFQDELGSTGKSPRWVIAYKFAAEQAISRIIEITVQVGRTGALTPVAELEPTLLSGSRVARATLHNQEDIERKDIRIGDFVILEKGGDVIPKITKVLFERRKEPTRPWKLPEHCPSCKAKVVKSTEEVAVRCPNGWNCPEQRVRRLLFFVSKDAMDIEHLGEQVVRALVQKGLVHRYADFYRLREKDLATLEGFKEKSIQNVLKSIEKSRHVSLSRCILALGIKHVGEGTAEALAEKVGSIQTLFSISLEELKEIEGIGDIVARAIREFFDSAESKEEIQALIDAGLEIEKVHQKVYTNHLFSGKHFVLTGTLEEYTRDQAIHLIKERGGKVISSVSAKTEYLLVGHDAGSKFEKAKALGIPILTEQKFKELL